MSAVRLWTLGHSTREFAELLEILQDVPIERLVDVRTLPRSRRNPQFDRDSLAWELEQATIVYRHAPELGGSEQELIGALLVVWFAVTWLAVRLALRSGIKKFERQDRRDTDR